MYLVLTVKCYICEHFKCSHLNSLRMSKSGQISVTPLNMRAVVSFYSVVFILFLCVFGSLKCIAMLSEKDRASVTVNIYTETFVKFGHVVFEICERTDIQTERQTYRHTDRNTSHPCRVWSKYGQKVNRHEETWIRTSQSAVCLWRC